MRRTSNRARIAVVFCPCAWIRAAQDHVPAEFGALRRDYEALVDATQIITDERDAQRRRIAELEAVNKRLVDMLWGRRTWNAAS